jgi:hypothetical protein
LSIDSDSDTGRGATVTVRLARHDVD